MAYLTTTTATLLALAAFLRSTLALSDYSECSKKNPHAVQAIQFFCSNTAFTVPSTYAGTKMHVGTGGEHDTNVWVDGTCDPPQWVPNQFCLSQLYAMCATGNKYGGANTQYFGAGDYKCQEFNLEVKGFWT